MPHRPHLALVLDPRFSGGTSSAVAQEIRALHPVADLTIVFVESSMFSGRSVNPRIAAALEATGLEAVWDPPVVRAETIVLHNPSFLKFDEVLRPRFNCGRAIVVSHENFLRPNGKPGFDVARCLDLVGSRLPLCPRLVAPVSPYNRRGVERWLAEQGSAFAAWRMASIDWFNVCDFPIREPVHAPSDRRGRVSRAGFEKFPDSDVMLRHFPAKAQRCAILGGDSFLLLGPPPPTHWCVLPFGSANVSDFLTTIDFFVYFTHPTWRESFGRVIAEAIAAGKVVITDPGTAETFGDAVVASEGEDVDAIIAGFCAEPKRYRDFVETAQRSLARFGAEAFREGICGFLAAKSALEKYDALC